ncbi:MAG TPA: hypothetical protein VII42_00610 [Caulobacteraceae bacterium]
MNSKIKTLIAAASLVLAIGGAASSASAATVWQTHNDHRVVVAPRFERHNLRVREEMRLRELNLARIHRLHIAAHRARFEHHMIRHIG